MVDNLVAGVRAGNRRAIARMMTRVENRQPGAVADLSELYPATGRAHIVGITGSPGSGKSTLVNELAKSFRKRGPQVGIIAVDPTSPFTGGALLGDRVRMRDLSGDSGIFIRSLASRGRLGGLSAATSDMIKVLDAGGFDIILVETVGAGQAEVDIAATAHTTIVVEAPGMGDEVQTIKAGILEIADILVVNKADRPGARNTVRALKTMLQIGMPTRPVTVNGEATTSLWEVPVLEVVAIDGTGVETLVDTITQHRNALETSGEWQERERDRVRQEMMALLQARFQESLEATIPFDKREQLIKDVAARRRDPYSAVELLANQLVK